jgi:hypothetical protein
MAAAQQGRKFTNEEAQRFAALMAGFDTGNASQEESAVKGQMMRRMVAEKGLRLVDTFELPEIRYAIDRQLQPVRAAERIVNEVRTVNEGCDCDPWPLQMFWFFVGVVAWIVRGAVLVVRAGWRIGEFVFCALPWK